MLALTRLMHRLNVQRLNRRSRALPVPTTLVLGAPSDRALPILVGRPAGQAWSRQVGLDRLPVEAPVVIRRDPAVYAVTSSFWLGAFTPRILAAGSWPTFLARHHLDLNALDRESLAQCVARVLIERSMVRRPWWRLGR